MNLWSALRGRPSAAERSISTIDDYAAALNEFVFNGVGYGTGVTQTLQGGTERVPSSLEGYAAHAYAANGVVFACMAVRMLVFSAIRFQWQRLNSGRPSEMFGTPALSILETPWPGGTTQDLLTRMIQDADMAGNSYWTAQGGELVRLRPDWVEIVLEPRRVPGRRGVVGYRRAGYVYTEGGAGASEPVPFLPDEVAHYAPMPDPLATYRGMSWLTPVLREIRNDAAMEGHKAKFFENGATPNMVVSMKEGLTADQFEEFVEKMDSQHKGVRNAYKTLYLGNGADVSVVGNSFEQMSFKAVQGAGETRIAAAAGVPPVIVGLSEGLQSATYSNYAQARRRLADGTAHPLWQNAAGSLAPLIQPPAAAGSPVRLWYDARDVPFLREDRADQAKIQSMEAQSMRTLLDAGYTAESVVSAVQNGDWGLLSHSGLFSVQLQPPGTTADASAATDTPPPGNQPADQPAADAANQGGTAQ